MQLPPGLIFFIALIFIGVAVLLLRGIRQTPKSERGKSAPQKRSEEPQNAGLDPAESAEMLENVRNMARTNPGQVAQVVSDWLKDDRPPMEKKIDD